MRLRWVCERLLLRVLEVQLLSPVGIHERWNEETSKITHQGHLVGHGYDDKITLIYSIQYIFMCDACIEN